MNIHFGAIHETSGYIQLRTRENEKSSNSNLKWILFSLLNEILPLFFPIDVVENCANLTLRIERRWSICVAVAGSDILYETDWIIYDPIEWAFFSFFSSRFSHSHCIWIYSWKVSRQAPSREENIYIVLWLNSSVENKRRAVRIFQNRNMKFI